jgi:hypothetical protein
MTHWQTHLTARHEFQKLLLDVNKELIRDPTLWGVWHDHPMNAVNRDDPLQKAKLEAFVYMKLNIYHIVFEFSREAGKQGSERRAVLDSWTRTCSDFLNNSKLAKEILARPDTRTVYDPEFLAFLESLIKREVADDAMGARPA